MTKHLSSEELDEAMSGRVSEASAVHLKSCARCEQELASLREMFVEFRSQAVAVAEHHRRFAPEAGRRRVPRMAWAMALAVLVVSVGAPLAVHRRGVVVAPQVSEAPVAMSDEALLNSVQNDLSSSVPEPLLPLAGTSSNSNSSNNEPTKN